MDTTPEDPPANGSGGGDSLAAFGRRVGAAMSGGLMCGVVIGGIGGRLAMLLLRVTSGPRVHGIESDDGFRIGQISGDTLFLLLFTAVLGALGGLFYLVVRLWLPPRGRAPALGVFGGIVGGAAVIKPGGVDFVLLSPQWLAVVVFVAIPAAYGVALSVVIERLLAREGSGFGLRWVAFLPLLVLLFLGPFGLGLALVLVLAWSVGRAFPPLARVWRSPVVTWLGRAALVAITGLAAVALAHDVATIF